MKVFYFVAYLYHKFFRFVNRKKGKYQSPVFEYHHKKMKKYKLK